MKHRLLAIFALALIASHVSAQNINKPVKPQAAKPAIAPKTNKPVPAQPEAPQPPAPKAPSGIGEIKLGMTKEALLALPESSPVRLAGALTPAAIKKDSPPPKPGQTSYEGSLFVPDQQKPLKATFTFFNDTLHSFGIEFEAESRLFDQMADDIAKKYGPGKVDDGIKEEDCIYRNGNSFKIKSGIRLTEWEDTMPDGRFTKTTLMDLQFAMCPSSLRDTLMSVKTKALSIGITDKPATPKSSLF